LVDPIELDLLLEAQQGDINAYEELQLLLEPPIKRFVRRMMNNEMLEDDIVQDVFISFYQHLTKIDPPENLRPYIYRIARNRCYDEMRRMGRRESLSLDEEPVQVRVSFTESHTQPQPEDVTHWILLHMEVREAMNQLPDAQRRALILYSEEEMSYAEIAEIEGVSIGTVKSRLYYAKKNLRQYMNPDTLDVILEEFKATVQEPQSADNEGEKDHEEILSSRPIRQGRGGINGDAASTTSTDSTSTTNTASASIS
jgi:RNA polymerase sigma-70 factor (ECF subfamily)